MYFFSTKVYLLTSNVYNPFLVYCHELAPGTVSLTGDRAQGDDSKYYSHYKYYLNIFSRVLFCLLVVVFSQWN